MSNIIERKKKLVKNLIDKCEANYQKLINIYLKNPNFELNRRDKAKIIFKRKSNFKNYTYVSLIKTTTIITIIFSDDKHNEHRLNGPSSLSFYGSNMHLYSKHWSIKNKAHRENGPAVIQYRSNKVIRETWYQNDKKHRENGPAEIIYNLKGNIVDKYYFLDGEIIDEELKIMMIEHGDL